MASPKIKVEILEELRKITQLEPKSIGEKISRKKSETGLSSNAVAHLIALDYGKSLLRKLDEEDKAAIRQYQLINRVPAGNISRTIPRKTTIVEKPFKAFRNYRPLDYFAEQYILEVSRAYKAKCYTSVFILTRKIVENLVIKIIEAKFPSRDDLIYNTKKTRTLDFSAILANLQKESSSFSLTGQSVIARLIPLIEPFKEDANAKAHRWFHVVTSPTEVENWQLQTIMELIKLLETEVGIRTS